MGSTDLQVRQEVHGGQNLAAIASQVDVEQPDLAQVAQSQQIETRLHIGLMRAGGVVKADVDVQAALENVALPAKQLQAATHLCFQ